MTASKDYAAIKNLAQLRRLVDHMIAADKPIGFD